MFSLTSKRSDSILKAVAKDFITLNRRSGLAKIEAAKRAIYYYRPKNGISVEREADLAQLARTFGNDPRMKMMVRIADSHHTIVVIDTKKLKYGYELYF